MISALVALFSYLLFAFIHILIHRYLVRIGKERFASIGVFFIGFIIHAMIAFQFLPLPWTSIIAYSLLSWLHSILFTGPYNNDTGPSMTIYFALRSRLRMTHSELLNVLSDEILILQRLRHLQSSGLITKNHGTYTATPRGKRLDTLLESYRGLLGWKSSG